MATTPMQFRSTPSKLTRREYGFVNCEAVRRRMLARFAPGSLSSERLEPTYGPCAIVPCE
eukprot:7800091-Lingulodinium_polyedra.AAC.1